MLTWMLVGLMMRAILMIMMKMTAMMVDHDAIGPVVCSGRTQFASFLIGITDASAGASAFGVDLRI